MKEPLDLRLVKDGDEDAASYPVIWVQESTDRNPLVKLHLPTENHWSGEMTIDDAEAFIRRVEFNLEHGLEVQVLDPHGLWPAHWQALSE